MINQIRPSRSEQLDHALTRSALSYISQDGKFQYVSSSFQKQTGYTNEELIGRDCLSFIHPDDRELVKGKAVENLERQSYTPYEYRFIKKNGDFMCALEKVTSAEYAGKPAVVAVFMDITERKSVESGCGLVEPAEINNGKNLRRMR